MEKYELIKWFMQELESCEAKLGQSPDVNQFCNYIKFKESKPEVLLPKPGRGQLQPSIPSEIARLVTTLNRYARFYFKVILENEPAQSIDEVVFLIILMDAGSLSKSELISRAVAEKTTGIETIKRMEQNGLVLSRPNPSDARSKLIAVAPGGFALMQRMFPRIDKVSKVVTGNLSEEEQITLVHLLNKLDEFHKPIYLNGKQKDWINTNDAG